MNEAREIRDRIRKIAGIGDLGDALFTAEVTSVTGTDCTVVYGELPLEKVKLFSIGDAGTLLVKPKVGSKVTVADLSMGKLRDLVLVKIDQVELIQIIQDNLTVEIDTVSKKIDVANSTTSLTKLFDQVAEILGKMKVLTPQGPSEGVHPEIILLVEKLKQDYKTLLK